MVLYYFWKARDEIVYIEESFWKTGILRWLSFLVVKKFIKAAL